MQDTGYFGLQDSSYAFLFSILLQSAFRNPKSAMYAF